MSISDKIAQSIIGKNFEKSTFKVANNVPFLKKVVEDTKNNTWTWRRTLVLIFSLLMFFWLVYQIINW